MKLRTFLFTTLGCSLLALSANADHRWGNYHWATEDGTVYLPAVDQTTADWQGSYDESLNRWEQSASIDHAIREQGDESSRQRQRCNAVLGKLVTCNYTYGFNGWAGLASINIDSNSHITQGVAKMNDTYLASYATDYRNHVMCQEIGHVYGLGHTSEDGSSQQTCMDYSGDLNSQWPNAHDYETLTEIYNHTDGYTTVATGGGTTEPPAECKGGWKKCGGAKPSASNIPGFGIKVMQTGKHQIWVSPGENGSTWIHHVTLAEGYTDIVHDDGDEEHH